MKKISNKASIKCTFANQIHKLFESLLTDEQKTQPYYRKYFMKKQLLNAMTKEQKEKFLEEITIAYFESCALIENYHQKSRTRKAIQKARIARGWKPKKKTTKEDYLKQQS